MKDDLFDESNLQDDEINEGVDHDALVPAGT